VGVEAIVGAGLDDGLPSGVGVAVGAGAVVVAAPTVEVGV